MQCRSPQLAQLPAAKQQSNKQKHTPRSQVRRRSTGVSGKFNCCSIRQVSSIDNYKSIMAADVQPNRTHPTAVQTAPHPQRCCCCQSRGAPGPCSAQSAHSAPGTDACACLAHCSRPRAPQARQQQHRATRTCKQQTVITQAETFAAIVIT